MTQNSQVQPHILLVEDDRTHQMFCCALLEGMGLAVTHAPHGQAAIALLRRQPFDLVLMDCEMPVMDGYEASRRIQAMRASREIADIPVVALTANTRTEDVGRCFQAGMDDYIAKSLLRDRWKPEIAKVLGKWLPGKVFP